MKKLPSSLFPNCEFSADDDAGFYDITPEGFSRVVCLYISTETAANDMAIANAAKFFDNVPHWDKLCRGIFLSFEKESEDYETVASYFDFYKDEVPEVFHVDDVSALSLKDMVDRLQLKGMATHGSGDEQTFVVDFTLGYDQLLCVKFDSENEFDHIAWES